MFSVYANYLQYGIILDNSKLVVLYQLTLTINITKVIILLKLLILNHLIISISTILFTIKVLLMKTIAR